MKEDELDSFIINFLGEDSIYALVEKGETLSIKGEYKEALDCFTKALDMVPEDIFIMLDIGEILYNLGRYEEAIQIFNIILELDYEGLVEWESSYLKNQAMDKVKEASKIKKEPGNRDIVILDFFATL